MTIFTEEDLLANIRLNLTKDTPAGILNANHEEGYKSPSRGVFSLRDCIDQGWFGTTLDTATRQTEYLTKVHVTFRRTWETAKYYLEAFTQAKSKIQELETRVQELEQATQHVAETSIQREQTLKDNHRDEVHELQIQIHALKESKEQLEERFREDNPTELRERYEAAKRLLQPQQDRIRELEQELASGQTSLDKEFGELTQRYYLLTGDLERQNQLIQGYERQLRALDKEEAVAPPAPKKKGKFFHGVEDL